MIWECLHQQKPAAAIVPQELVPGQTPRDPLIHLPVSASGPAQGRCALSSIYLQDNVLPFRLLTSQGDRNNVSWFDVSDRAYMLTSGYVVVVSCRDTVVKPSTLPRPPV